MTKLTMVSFYSNGKSVVAFMPGVVDAKSGKTHVSMDYMNLMAKQTNARRGDTVTIG